MQCASAVLYRHLWPAKSAISFVMSVRLSVRIEQLGCHWTDFHEISYLKIFRKSVEEIQVSLKSEKNNGYFTWRSMYNVDHISLISFQNEKCFRQNCGENQNTHFVFSNFFFPRKSCRLWDNVEKYCRSGQATDDTMAHAHCTLDI